MLVYRKKSNSFFSIEKVFNVLVPFLYLSKVELPFESQGLKNRIKNILFLLRQNVEFLHITGHDHYLLWYPFKKTILTIHDIEALRRKKGVKKWLFKKLWFDIPIKNAAIVTTISEFTKEELNELGNYKTPIKVIPNPLTLQAAFEPNSQWSEKIKILHIGTKENKNIERLVEALQGVNCQLTIIGILSDLQKNIIDESDISYVNRFQLSEQELITEYENCDLLAFVSTYEGFGLPIIEAQAMGRVVLTSNVASMPEVAGDGALLVDPYSVESIRNGINRLLEDASLREDLIQKGKENVKRFEPRLIAELYQELYRELGEE